MGWKITIVKNVTIVKTYFLTNSNANFLETTSDSDQRIVDS